jgi:acetolactate synthase-1/2/3 large subunit
VLRGVLHESRDQAALFEPLAKAVLRPRTAEDAVRAVAEAVGLATAWPRGPVYVDIPTDVLDHEAPPALVPAPAPAPQADPAQLAAAVDAMGAAVQVVIWAGGGVVQSEASAELAELAERLGAPVVTTFAARGVLPPGHPWSVGLPPHEPEVARLVGDADLLLVVGSELDGPMTRNWSMPRPPLLVNVNVDPAALTTGFAPDVAVVGDARHVLAALAAALPARSTDDSALRRTREGTWARLRADEAGAPALRFLDSVDRAVEATDAVVVCDMTIPGYWYGGYGRVAGPRRLQYPIGWGTLGYALPASIGAASIGAASTGGAVLAICGDGGFMYAVGELAVLRQQVLPVTVLVVDDGGYGMLRFDQDRAGDDHRGVDLARPDFAALAASFGITAVRAVVDDLEAHLGDALSSREPRMVVLELALTPPRTTSPRWRD